MGQAIKLKIAGKEYKLEAASPEYESKMRIAAQEINETLSDYDLRYPDQSFEDKLVFIALSYAVAGLTVQQKFAELSEDIRKLRSDTDAYLEDINKN